MDVGMSSGDSAIQFSLKVEGISCWASNPIQKVTTWPRKTFIDNLKESIFLSKPSFL